MTIFSENNPELQLGEVGAKAQNLDISPEAGLLQLATADLDEINGIQESAEGQLVESAEKIDSNLRTSEVCETGLDESKKYLIACRIGSDDADETSVVIRKKRVESYCDLSDDASYDDKPEIIQFVFTENELQRVGRFLSQLNEPPPIS